ncbi:MAG: CPBP family intramembrane metalloprotease, partial [Anaerolineae bacterium]|nr:CPBP family intramembrane metalloprotease [Anaerolineae bacterium]
IRRHPLLTFFVLSYILSWLFWLPESLWPGGNNGLATWLGNCGSAIAGAVVVAITLGAAGVRDLLARLFRWRAPLVWYVVALTLPLALQIINVGVYAATGSLPPDYDPGVWSANLPQIIPGFLLGTLFGLLASAGEEVGWRGYAVPTLLRRRGPLATSLLIGVVWGFWHFAPYQVPADGPDWGFALLFVVGTTSASVFYTWLYTHTRGSLIIASLFHSSYNMTAMTVMAGVPVSVFPGYVAIFTLASLIIVVMEKWNAWRVTPHLRHA